MLAFTVKTDEPIWIGENIAVFVHKIYGHDKVRIAIDAPKDVVILRDSVKERMQDENGLYGDS